MAPTRTVSQLSLLEARSSAASNASLESVLSNSVNCLVKGWNGDEPCQRIRVENRVGRKADAYFTVSKFATIDALLGLCAGYFKFEINGTIGLYSSDGQLLYGTKKIKDLIKSEDTVYLQRKQRGDDCLFRTNWCFWASILLVVSLIVLTIITCLHTMTGRNSPFKSGIVIDAGSSHSTAHLFHWDAAKANGTGRAVELAAVTGKRKGIDKLTPNDTYFEIEDILTRMKKHIENGTTPGDVPVYLAATAGMRLLMLANVDRAMAVMWATVAAMRDSGFDFRAAELIDGVDEGVYDWVALNYEAERIRQKLPTFGALDLGGASLEVAIEVSNPAAATRNLTLFGSDYHVFSQSALCFGNDQAYYRYLMTLLINNGSFAREDFTVDSPCHCNGFTGTVALSTILGPCTINPHLPKNISDISDDNITLIGVWNPDKCQNLTNQVIDVNTCQRNGFSHCFDDLAEPLPMNQSYVAFSAYYFIVREARFSSKNISDLTKKAKTFCDLDYDQWLEKYYNGSTERSVYGCWKINFVDRIFTSKYGFDEEGFKNVLFTQKMNNVKIAWPMGYMLKATNSIPPGHPSSPMLTTVPFIILMVVCVMMLCAAFIMFRCYHQADLRKVQGLMFASSILPA